MNEKDDSILEYLDGIHPAAEPLGVVHWNLQNTGNDWSYHTTRRRLEGLLDHGMLEVVREDPRYFRISDIGKGYLRGEVDASELGSDEGS